MWEKNMESVQQSTILNYNDLPDQEQLNSNNCQNGGRKVKPYVKIMEQPASKALRFRYECEGRSAGSIPGMNSTIENKTYPSIEIVGYKGRAVVVVSCVTREQPYRPHPHNLVGKEGCKKGVCTLEINPDTMRAVFSNLGIQCVKKKDIEAALKAREEIRVDPFKTGFAHRLQPSCIDLNSVRLCFQVFMESDQKGRFTQPLPPVVSEPIYDKKSMADLVICRLCSCSASVLGNTQIILLCEKVTKDDISIRFYEEKDGNVIWEAFGEFQQTDVHKQTAISFKTPRYHNIDITEPTRVSIQLRRPSDGVTSESLPFEYIPLDSGRHRFWDMRRNLKRKPDDVDVFQEILSYCSAKTKNTSIPNLDINTSRNNYTDLTNINQIDNNNIILSNVNEIDNILEDKLQEIEQEHLQMNSISNIVATPKMEKDLDMDIQVNPIDKITEWMKFNELDINDNLQIHSNINDQQNFDINSEEKVLNDLLEEVAELDEIYTEHNLINQKNLFNINNNNNILNEVNRAEMDENFDDAATYTSLQIAYKNPIDIPITNKSWLSLQLPLQHEFGSISSTIDNSNDFLKTQSVLLPSQVTPPPRPPQLKSPLSTTSLLINGMEFEKAPPLPPKRLCKQDSDTENRSIEANSIEIKPFQNNQSTSVIHVMNTSDYNNSLLKKLPIKRNEQNKSNTLPKPKKTNFLLKLFSRRKNKCISGNNQESVPSTSKSTNSTIHSDITIRVPRKLQTTNNSPTKTNIGKPVCRSVSSVSSKRFTNNLDTGIIHIPLKGESTNSLPQNEAYSQASTITLSNTLDRRTASALQLADIPINDGNMELIAITDRQSLRNLCEGEFNVQLDPNVDLTEAEHFALYTSIPPQATASEFDETSTYYAPIDAGQILTPEEVTKRLVAANSFK